MRRAVRDYRYEVNESKMTDECVQYLTQLQKDWERHRVKLGVEAMRKEVESGSPLYHFYINIRNSRYPIKKMTETIVSRHLSLSPRHRQSLPLPFPQLTLRITRPLNTILICYSTEPKKSQHGNLQNHHKFWASYWIPDTCFHYFSPLTLGCSAFPQRSLLLQMQKKSVRVAKCPSREEVPAGPVQVIVGRWNGVLGIVEFVSLVWRLCNM